MFSMVDNFEYENKSWYLKQADVALTPLRTFLNGKTVNCVKNEDNSITFRLPNKDKPQRSALSQKIGGTLFKGIQGVATVVFSPLIAIALGAKALNEDERIMESRFNKAKDPACKKDPQERDTVQERELLEDNESILIIEKIMARPENYENYDELKQTAVILGDKIMRKDKNLSKFEGGGPIASSRLLKQELSKFANDSVIGEDVKRAIKLIEEYNHWYSRCYAVTVKKDLVDDFAKDFKKRIETLKVGESLLFPYWTKTHVITLKFTRTEENTCALKVFNVGEGAEHHHWVSIDVPNGQSFYMFAPFHIQGIPLQHVSSVDQFLLPFLRQATEFSPDENCNRFYQFLKSSFQDVVGEANFNVEPTHANAYKRGQGSGICAWKSLLAALKDSMPLESYKRFMLLMKRDKWWGLELQKSSLKEDALPFWKDGNRQLASGILKYDQLINHDKSKLKIFRDEQWCYALKTNLSEAANQSIQVKS